MGQWEIVSAHFADESVLLLVGFDEQHFKAERTEVHFGDIQEIQYYQ